MYSKNGDFGQVKIERLIPSPQNEGLFALSSVGWHSCNERYRISRPQGSEDYLILITVGGRGFLKLSDNSYDLPVGSLAFIPRNTPHSYRVPKGEVWEFYWIHPTGGLANLFLDSLALKGNFVGKFSLQGHLPEKAEKLLALCREHSPEAAVYISKALGDILHFVTLDLFSKTKAVSLSAEVISYIEQNYKASVKIEEIAKAFFVSTAHLIREFKKENGCTPHQYLIKYRLISAKHLLEYSDLKVEEVAAKTGFSSASHFISCFRGEYGCTPMQYHEHAFVM